jgi:hypothetical protein
LNLHDDSMTSPVHWGSHRSGGQNLTPSVGVEVRPIRRLHTLDQLDAGTIELALETPTEGGERFKCSGLLEDAYLRSCRPITHRRRGGAVDRSYRQSAAHRRHLHRRR